MCRPTSTACSRAWRRCPRTAATAALPRTRRWSMPMATRPSWRSCWPRWLRPPTPATHFPPPPPPPPPAAGYLWGGRSARRTASVQFAVGGDGNMAGQGGAGGVFDAGLSGVAFGAGVALVSRVTQGCQPVSALHRITAAQNNLVLTLDDKPALDMLLDTLGVSLESDPQPALRKVRATLAGLVDAGEQPRGQRRMGHFGTDTRVRHIVGLDGLRRGVALADAVQAGMQLAFCQRNAAAARADLMRICAEIREELSPEELAIAPDMPGRHAAPQTQRRICGAIYVSCSGRGGPHFGGPGAELHIVRHALGDVPLAG